MGFHLGFGAPRPRLVPDWHLPEAAPDVPIARHRTTRLERCGTVLHSIYRRPVNTAPWPGSADRRESHSTMYCLGFTRHARPDLQGPGSGHGDVAAEAIGTLTVRAEILDMYIA
jgi:hypothetical protein